MGYRDRLDIIADILGTARETNVKKTRIMFQANLSHKVLQRYLSYVVEASLLSFNSIAKNYGLTDKGRTFLKTYDEYAHFNQNIKEVAQFVKNKRNVLLDLCGNGDNPDCQE